MPTVRTAITALYAVLFLFSCNSKQKQPAQSEVTNSDSANAVTILPDEELNIQNLTGDFVNAVTQKFIVAKNKTAVITGKKGLRITVHPSVLEKADGTAVDGAVQVSLVELTSSTDLYKANAATVCNGRLLASGGSYFIGMKCNGQEVHIKKGRFLQIDLPVLSEGEMELFYGQRDAAGNMNWLRAGVPLAMEESKEEIIFTDSSRFAVTDFYPAFMYDTGGKAKIYQSTSEQVYLYDHKVTIRQLVDTINRAVARIFIDTVYVWPKQPANLPQGARIDSNFLYRVYGPPKQFIIKRYKDAGEEAAKKEKERIALERARKNYQPKTLAGQIQKYYGPTNITALGWINCDRFYNTPENSELQMELPITFAKPTVQYFVIYKSFNGLISGTLKADSAFRYHLPALPKGEPVTLVAFTKANGKLYQYVKDMKIEARTILQPDFKEITVAELKKIFGSNVRT